MKTVHEIGRISGVSVRTLHHYDAIGLLKPTAVTEAGYRLYDDTALLKLQSILFFRELEFPLKEIKAIFENPNFDYVAALKEQLKLFELKKKRIENLIALAKETIETGVIKMDFSPFGKKEIEELSKEAREKWGSTAEFKEFEEKQSEGKTENAEEKMLLLFSEIGKERKKSPASPEAQAAVKRLQAFINENFYTCTDEILSSLGLIYTADECFKKNIDRFGGEGTAEFVSRAIEEYCKKRNLIG